MRSMIIHYVLFRWLGRLRGIYICSMRFIDDSDDAVDAEQILIPLQNDYMDQ